MAIYHCSVKIIGRNAGRSSVAAAAYRSAECLTNAYDGIEHDFRKKNWVEYKEILLPENALKEYQDRSTLWNAVEMIEKSKDAQLAREFEVALPIEFSREQQIEVVKRFVKEHLTSQGMIVDIAIHNPPVTNDRHQPIDKLGNVTKDKKQMQFINPHAHILCTVRPLDEYGKWQKKSEVEYVCKKDGEEKALTAIEFNTLKDDGWEKQYKYYDGDKKSYYTPSEAKEKELERVNRSPKTTPYGRKNKIVEYWNSKDRILEWRLQWEKVVNYQFEKMQSDIRIDSRSFKKQGREDEVPTLHMGTAAINIEKRADRELCEGKMEFQVVRSDIGYINKEIKAHNKLVKELKVKFDIVIEKAKDFMDEVAKRLELIRAKLIGNKYEEELLTKKLNHAESVLSLEGNLIEKFEREMKKVDDANKQSFDKIQSLTKELELCVPFQVKKKLELQKQIQNEHADIEYRKEYLQGIARMCQLYSQDDIKKANNKHMKNVQNCEKLKETIELVKEDYNKMISEYKLALKDIPIELKQDVNKKCIEERSKTEKIVVDSLLKKCGDDFDLEEFERVKKSVEKTIASLDKTLEMENIKNKKISKSRHH